MNVKRTKTESITFSNSVTAGELFDFLNGLPKGAKVEIDHYEGNQREPEVTTLTVSWEVAKG